MSRRIDPTPDAASDPLVNLVACRAMKGLRAVVHPRPKGLSEVEQLTLVHERLGRNDSPQVSRIQSRSRTSLVCTGKLSEYYLLLGLCGRRSSNNEPQMADSRNGFGASKASASKLG